MMGDGPINGPQSFSSLSVCHLPCLHAYISSMVQAMHVQMPLEVQQPEMDYNAMAPNFISQHPEGEDIDLGLSLSTSLQQGTYNHPPGRCKISISLVAVLFLSLLLSSKLFVY